MKLHTNYKGDSYVSKRSTNHWRLDIVLHPNGDSTRQHRHFFNDSFFFYGKQDIKKYVMDKRIGFHHCPCIAFHSIISITL